MKKYFSILIIFLFTLFFYLPILLKTNILTNRGNDLTEFFWPIFYFVRGSILKYHELPFWNNLFFSGTPLLPDPQSPLFYLPNIVFLIFKNIDLGFIISIYLHIFAAGIGMYLLAKKGFKFSNTTSLFSSFIYIVSPKLSGYIEAGHFGLIASWGWLPFAFLVTILLAQKPTLKRSVFLSIILAGLFYTHILIFIITTTSICILFIYLTLSNKNNSIKSVLYLMLAGIICFGLISVTFLPQITWQNDTTRNLLLNTPDVYPKWTSKIEFLKASISPIIYGPKFIWELDTEKTIGVGLFITILSTFGFTRLKQKNKILVLILIAIFGFISLNNVSPFYNLLIKQNWYILLRVSTRFWFLLIFILLYLSGLGIKTLIKHKKIKFLTYVIMCVAIIELLLTSWTKILKPIKTDMHLAPREIYQFLSKDKGYFRVFCLNRCLSQKESAIYGLELADGYGTLQQKNYYEYSQQLSQSFYRNRYTLSIPPFEIFEFESLQPYSPNLAAFNIKYVVSSHALKDIHLKLVSNIKNYLIYENEINNNRSNYPISFYSPNFIQVDTSNFIDNKVILSEVYNKDWHAFSNESKKIKINESLDKTREVTIDKNTRYVNFIYSPESFQIGGAITLITIISLISFFSFQVLHNKQNNSKS